MVNCAAYGCNTNGTHRISLFSFPREERRKKRWLKNLTRGSSATRDFVPSRSSKLCMKHFEDNQFLICPKFAETIGYGNNFRVRLKPDAVPTIFKRHPGQEEKRNKERLSSKSISRKKLVNTLSNSCVKTEKSSLSAVVDTNTDQLNTDQLQYEEIFTAIPLTAVKSTTTQSIVTTTAVSSMNCLTVQSSPCTLTSYLNVPTTTAPLRMTVPFSPCSLNWFADVTCTLPKIQITKAPSNVTLQSSQCPLNWFADTISTMPKLPTTTVSSKTPAQSSLGPQDLPTIVTEEQPPAVGKGVISTQTQTPHNLVKRRSMKTQCPIVNTESKGTQTSHVTLKLPDIQGLNETLNSSILSIGSDDTRDPDWEPIIEESDSDEECEQLPKEKKFIVFESCLDKLLNRCSVCGSKAVVKKKTVGSCLLCDITCEQCFNSESWQSQPMCKNMPLGNLQLSAAVMFTGGSPVKFLRALDFAAIQNISLATFNNIQSAYLNPTILSVWQHHKQSMLADIRIADRPLRLAGDMRCCTPGHTAKYGSYSVLDLEANKILDFQLVQSNEVQNSYAMELEGLTRVLERLIETEHLTVTDLITDRHSSVKKYMKEEWPNINHWFDVWHVAKGIYKKLESAGKKKGCQKVKDWARSVSNHVYWCAASSGGDGELVQQKWLSIMNHVANIHEGHGDKFPACEHGQLEGRDWMKKGFKPHSELEKIVTGKLLLQDIKKLSPDEQTSSLESFHNIVCQFASKKVHYFYAQMEARIALAALHFNENAGRAQAQNDDGSAQWKVSFPKSRKGQAIAKAVKVEPTFSYIEELMDSLVEKRQQNCSYARAREANRIQASTIPKPLAQSTPRPKKEDIVKYHWARFNR